MSVGHSDAARREWALGWKVVAAGFVGLTLSNMHTGAMGVLMHPLSQQYGWTRAEISASVAIVSACLLVCGPMTGALVDRFSLRRLALGGVVLFFLALGGVGLSGPSIWSWYLAWLLVGLTYSAVSAIVWCAAITRIFDVKRGLALAVALSGMGFANLLSPILTVLVFDGFGWRGVYIALAAAGLLIGLPLTWLLLDDRGRAAGPQAVDTADATVEVSGMTVAEALRSARFWIIIFAFMFVALAVGTLFFHFQPILRDRGIGAHAAALYAALIGPSLVAGRLLSGYLMDHLPPHYVTAVAFSIPVLSILLLLNIPMSTTLAVVIAITVGASYGAEANILAYLVSRYFGMRRFGLLYAILYCVYSFSFGVAPVIAGATFDALGSYEGLLWTVLVGLVASIGLILMLRRPALPST